MIHERRIIVAITGASGAIYARLLLEELLTTKNKLVHEVAVVCSEASRQVWKHETGELFRLPDIASAVEVKEYAHDDFFAPFASGSCLHDTMIVLPCSMGTLARIAQGVANDLITRAADVMLKERRRLILAPRETPLSLIHLRNMETITNAGGIICPANPSYYNLPKSVEELAMTVVNRVLSLAGLPNRQQVWQQGN